jgi:co-chaperonin GroES (HSP10)
MDMMSLKPYNRHLLVQLIETEEEDTSSILLPEDYSVKPSHCTVLLQDSAEDCTLEASPGDVLLVNATMLDKISVEGDTYYLILQNYVLGCFS